MNIYDLKLKAKDILNEKFSVYWKGAIIVYLLSFIFSSLISWLLGNSRADGLIGTLFSTILIAPLYLGLSIFLLKLVRGEECSIGDVYKGFGKTWPVVCLVILVDIFVSLWSLLLIIPGIVAAFSYSQSMLIMADKDLGAMESIDKSKQMMNGHKWEFFGLNLSFIGWILLCAITFGIACIYVVPYMQITNTLYYEQLKLENK